MCHEHTLQYNLHTKEGKKKVASSAKSADLFEQPYKFQLYPTRTATTKKREKKSENPRRHNAKL